MAMFEILNLAKPLWRFEVCGKCQACGSSIRNFCYANNKLMTPKTKLDARPVKSRGLKTDELTRLENKFRDLNLINSNQEHFFEVDTQGIRVLNILCSADYNYRISSQSMAMEKTNIGGRTIQVQKLVWTLGKQED